MNFCRIKNYFQLLADYKLLIRVIFLCDSTNYSPLDFHPTASVNACLLFLFSAGLLSLRQPLVLLYLSVRSRLARSDGSLHVESLVEARGLWSFLSQIFSGCSLLWFFSSRRLQILLCVFFIFLFLFLHFCIGAVDLFVVIRCTLSLLRSV